MKFNFKDYLTDTVYDILGSTIYAAGLYMFAANADFAPGGMGGLSIIINYLTDLPVGMILITLNIPFIIFSYRLLGRRFMLKSMQSIVINTIFLDFVFTKLPQYNGDPLLASLFSGALIGTGIALIYTRGSSTGGTDFLIMSIRKIRPDISLGQINNVINFVVIGFGGIVFKNVDAVLYGLICSLVNSYVVDKIMYGIGAGKLLLIITESGRGYDIAEKIKEKTNRGSSLVKSVGTYTKDERDLIYCACGNSQAHKIEKAAKEVDESCLVMVMETNEVIGNGFRSLNK